MPNHVKNVLKFKHLTSDDVDFILNTIATEIERPDTVDKQYAMDFDKVIPEPRFESECPDEFKVNKDSHIAEYEDRPWFDWYRWHIHYWDTKWNAYDCYSIIGKSYLTLVFSTAWSMAFPVIQKLSVMGYEYELRYADENYGSNCGILTWSSEQGLNHFNESKLKNPGQWARNLWNKY